MKNCLVKRTGPALLMAGLLSATPLWAQTLNFQPFAPTPTANDQYNFTGSANDSGNVNDGLAIYPDGAANDGFTYVANGRANMGQFFTTGSNPAGYHVAAIWIRQAGYTTDTVDTYWSFAADANPTFKFRLTDPSQVNTTGFALDTEAVSITGTEINNPGGFGFSLTGTGIWLRFGFSSAGTNIALLPNTKYGFDVMGADADFFETLGTTNPVYSGGEAYVGTATAGVPDDTTNLLVGNRVFLVEMVGDNWVPQYSAPTITNQPASLMVPQFANAVFAPGVSGTSPFGYQWYFNTNTLLVGQTNASLTLAAVSTNNGLIGSYSVVVTNSYGSVTSQVARLSVILPSVTTNLTFNASGGSILDQNGVGTGLTARLAGTGASIATDDPNLLLDTANGVLDIASPTCDFNGQLAMGGAEAIGFNLSSIGYNGTQSFVVTGFLTNSVVGVNYDQAGVFAGTASTNMVRGGIIYNTDFTADPGSYGVGNQNGNDIGIATAPAPVGEMVVNIACAAGVWSVSVNGQGVTPVAPLAYLNGSTDMTVGVFALNTSGTTTSTLVNGLTASLFTGPKLTITPTSGNQLTFKWNVVGAGLQSNANLSNPNGWTTVTGAVTSPYVLPVPASGSMYYRIAQ